MKRSKLVVLYCFVTGIALFSCKVQNPTANFDRGPMLENMGDHIILPVFESLANTATNLQVATENFSGDATLSTLQLLREAWLTAYKQFQHAAIYNFGPVANELFIAAVNTYPTSTTKIESYVASGIYNFSLVSNNNAKGFAALDYLLFGLSDNDDNVLVALSETNRLTYLEDVVEDIVVRCQSVYSLWAPAGDNYLSDFKSRDGNDVSSSSGMMLNGVIAYLEANLRDDKIGVPLGVRSSGDPLPEYCEALYASESVSMALEAVEEINLLFTGNNGVGLDDYLVAVQAKFGDQDLSQVIKNQLVAVMEKVAAIPEPLQETVDNNPAPVTAAYQELQKLTLLMKSDMMSSIGILITYQDNDGD